VRLCVRGLRTYPRMSAEIELNVSSSNYNVRIRAGVRSVNVTVCFSKYDHSADVRVSVRCEWVFNRRHSCDVIARFCRAASWSDKITRATALANK